VSTETNLGEDIVAGGDADISNNEDYVISPIVMKE